MRSFFRNRLVITVLIVISIVVLFSVISAYAPGNATPVAGIASAITSPFEKAFSWCAEGLGNLFSYITEFDSLKLENEALKEELLEKEDLIRKAEQYKEENEKLRDLLNITRDNEQFTLEMCDIISRPDGDFSYTFTIDKGSNVGIEVGDTVIVSEGYVGYVCEVGLNWCNVLSVIDSGLSVGGQNVRTKESMMCEGDYSLMKEGKLKLSYLPLDSSLYVGDEICTSGLGGNVPHGIMIGEISAVSTAKGGGSMQAEIAPFVDVNELTLVFVITDFVKEG